MKFEIELQMKELPKLTKLGLAPNDSPAGTLFIGSGDSYAAGLFAQNFSAGRCLCYAPSDLIQCPRLLADGEKQAFIVSTSGKTTGSRAAARLLREHGITTTVITHDKGSPLTKESRNIILLDYNGSEVATAGTIGFSASMLACYSVARGEVTTVELGSLHRQYARASAYTSQFLAEHKPSVVGRLIFVAETPLFPIALYASFKQFEVLGASSPCYQIDEFCHSPIFGLKPSDTVIILGFNSEKTNRLQTLLSDAGFQVCEFPMQNETTALLEAAMTCTFFAQLIALKLAETSGLEDCYFLNNKRLLEISSSMIY